MYKYESWTRSRLAQIVVSPTIMPNNKKKLVKNKLRDKRIIVYVDKTHQGHIGNKFYRNARFAENYHEQMFKTIGIKKTLEYKFKKKDLVFKH